MKRLFLLGIISLGCSCLAAPDISNPIYFPGHLATSGTDGYIVGADQVMYNNGTTKSVKSALGELSLLSELTAESVGELTRGVNDLNTTVSGHSSKIAALELYNEFADATSKVDGQVVVDSDSEIPVGAYTFGADSATGFQIWAWTNPSPTGFYDRMLFKCVNAPDDFVMRYAPVEGMPPPDEGVIVDYMWFDSNYSSEYKVSFRYTATTVIATGDKTEAITWLYNNASQPNIITTEPVGVRRVIKSFVDNLETDAAKLSIRNTVGAVATPTGNNTFQGDNRFYGQTILYSQGSGVNALIGVNQMYGSTAAFGQMYVMPEDPNNPSAADGMLVLNKSEFISQRALSGEKNAFGYDKYVSLSGKITDDKTFTWYCHGEYDPTEYRLCNIAFDSPVYLNKGLYVNGTNITDLIKAETPDFIDSLKTDASKEVIEEVVDSKLEDVDLLLTDPAVASVISTKKNPLPEKIRMITEYPNVEDTSVGNWYGTYFEANDFTNAVGREVGVIRIPNARSGTADSGTWYIQIYKLNDGGNYLSWNDWNLIAYSNGETTPPVNWSASDESTWYQYVKLTSTFTLEAGKTYMLLFSNSQQIISAHTRRTQVAPSGSKTGIVTGYSQARDYTTFRTDLTIRLGLGYVQTSTGLIKSINDVEPDDQGNVVIKYTDLKGLVDELDAIKARITALESSSL